MQAYNFIKKRLQHSCFPVKFARFLRTPFFAEHRRWLFQSIFHFKVFYMKCFVALLVTINILFKSITFSINWHFSTWQSIFFKNFCYEQTFSNSLLIFHLIFWLPFPNLLQFNFSRIMLISAYLYRSDIPFSCFSNNKNLELCMFQIWHKYQVTDTLKITIQRLP